MADCARMTRGNASPSHDPETPTSGVPTTRPTFADRPTSGGVTSGTTFSKLLVIGLVGVFLLAAASFILSASDAKRKATPAPGSTPAPAASVPIVVIPAAAAADATPPAAAAAAEPTPPDALATTEGATAVSTATAPTTDVGAAVDGSHAITGGVAPAGAVTGTISTDPETALAQTSPAPSGSPAPGSSPDPLISPVPSASVALVASPDPNASPLPLQDPAAVVDLRMPMVPVTGFWETQTSLTKGDLVDALKGNDRSWDRVLVPAADRAAIEAALGITIAKSVESTDVASIEKALKQHSDNVLAVVRASDVTFRMRSLGIGDTVLFGNDRIGNIDNWPLVATVQGPAGSAWNQKALWTLVAGGDSFTDRGIYERVVNRNKGIDYPFNGGTARVTGHHCCGPFVAGHEVPDYQLSGPNGIVRDMTKNADLAIANHESPIAYNWTFHLHGFFFSGKPALTEIFTRAGIDWFSLANNHMKDYGTSGIADTRDILDKYGIKYAGAGKDLAQARQYSILTVKGVKVAILPCSAIALSATSASDTGSGVMPCKNKMMLADIREASTKADVVIVFPHWGIEYDRDPQPYQRGWVQKWRKAGADVVFGAHSHVAGAIDEVDGMPVFYSLGNFIFDQNWATYTMESFLVEATFDHDQIVQLRLHPFLSHDQAQPNFLDPAKDDGKALMKAVRQASFIDW